ncbi:MAG: hypothetical protein SH818_18925, partial [Saprospiraceae bacterium]|nr:hypothetical protein [Saprospiraceae bacterium]
MKIKYFFITTVVMAATFYSAVVFFSPGTLRWTGGTSTDWNTVSNWTVVSGTPSIPPNKFSTGDHVIIDGTAPNFPEITIAANARSLTVVANAVLTVKSGGSLDVIGSDVDGVTNSGRIIVESMATMTIDSAFDDGLINMAGAKVINAGTFSIVNGFGSRIENHDSIINTGAFNVNMGVDTAVINFSTGVIKNAGSFFINGGNSSQLANYGKVLNESNSFTVTGGTAGILILNRTGSLIQNAGTFSVQSGSDRRIDNGGTIINSALFNVNGALAGEGIVNQVTGLITNTAGTFMISGGNATQLDNFGTVNNYSTFIIQGGGVAGNSLLNNASGVFNHISGTWSASFGNGIRVVNSGLISISAVATFGGGPGNSLTNNLTGIIEHYSGLLTINGFSGTGFQNDGTYHGGAASSITIPNGAGAGIVNTGTFIDTAGCSLDIHNLGGDLIHNSGLMYIDCNSMLYRNGSDGIRNTSTGVYRQNLGSITFYSFASDFIENDNYFYSDVPMNLAGGGTGNYLIFNKDSIILGPNSSLKATTGTSRFVFNGINGFLDNAGDWALRQGGNGAPVIQNDGIAYFRNTSSVVGDAISQNVITNTGIFHQDGIIEYRTFAFSLLDNSNYFKNSGSMKAGNLGFNVDAIINSDTLINCGIFEVDTTVNNGLSNTGYFLNDSTGIFYADFLGKNGIYNDAIGTVINHGALWIARDTGVSQYGIRNLGIFENYKLIDIGQKGPLFGGGILNNGLFSNLNQAEIFIDHVDTFGIQNNNNFLNACSYIESWGIIRDNNNFTNDGVIRKLLDTLNLNSNVAVNNFIIYNEDNNPFTSGGGSGQIINGPITCPDPAVNLSYCAAVDCTPYANITVIYVDTSANGANNGLNWDSAFTDLQDALAIARTCGVDTIKVAQGIYFPSPSDTLFDPCSGLPLVIPSRSLSFDIPDSTVLLGGYLSGGSIDRDWACNKTILSGDIDGNGDTLNNSLHVVYTRNVDSVIVDGFFIQGGNANVVSMADPLASAGGGWINDGS